jgi:hypothetical protein
LTPLNRFIQTQMSRLFSFCRGGIQFHAALYYHLATALQLDPAPVSYRPKAG